MGIDLEKELRGGNLVYRVIEDYEPLAEKKVVEWGWDVVRRIMECMDSEENYEFIPLTAEWLVRFGFKNDEGWSIDISEGDGRFDWFCIAEVRGGFYYSVGGNEYIIGKEIKWVHQLQNLYFALTGKELVLTAENGG